ncbi:MAG: carbohydrate ABC transporter permease [Anaerolineaceae bacterium]|nr:carbohydrate ABC transporter permease [Anaerolineaceae bacterium]
MATTTPTDSPRSGFDMQQLVMQIFLIGIGLIVALPILIAFFTSFKVPGEVITYPPKILPSEWTLDNYVSAWNSNPFGRFMINSFIQTSLITIGQVVFSILAAYAFALLEFPGRNILFYVILGSLMIPFELTVIPNFQLISNLGWANTYQGLAVPFLASAFGVFMLRQFFLTIPRDLHDAALIDGASNWRYLWQILVPLSKGSIGAFAIFAFLSAYNQYLWPLIITDDILMRTTQIGIRFFLVNLERGADWGAVMAAAIIVSAPTLIAFLVAQKQLVKGIAMTGLKG